MAADSAAVAAGESRAGSRVSATAAAAASRSTAGVDGDRRFSGPSARAARRRLDRPHRRSPDGTRSRLHPRRQPRNLLPSQRCRGRHVVQRLRRGADGRFRAARGSRERCSCAPGETPPLFALTRAARSRWLCSLVAFAAPRASAVRRMHSFVCTRSSSIMCSSRAMRCSCSSSFGVRMRQDTAVDDDFVVRSADRSRATVTKPSAASCPSRVVTLMQERRVPFFRT